MRIIPLLLLILTAGCSVKYVAPLDGDRAQVRIFAPQFAGFSGLRVVYYNESSCDAPMVFGVVSGLTTTDSDPGTSIPGASMLEAGAYVDRFITASPKVQMTFRGTRSNRICTAPVVFSLEKDKRYELAYSWKGDRCYVELNELVGSVDALQKVRVPVTRAENPCYSGFSGVAL